MLCDLSKYVCLVEINQILQISIAKLPPHHNYCASDQPNCVIDTVLMFLDQGLNKYWFITDYFRNLLKSDPYNHSLWNKYGAALSQMDEEDKAIECYRIALQLRPNYVRTYVNIGMA